MIAVRYRKLNSGRFSVYLDYTLKGARKYDFLKIYVSKDYSKSKRYVNTDVNSMNLVEQIKAQKELELFNPVTGNQKPDNNASECIIEFISNDTKAMLNDNYNSLIKKLKGFTSRERLPMSGITPKFLNNFFEYMEKGIARNTAVNYTNLLKAALNKAKREGILLKSPFKYYKIPGLHETDKTYLETDELRKLKDHILTTEPQIAQAFLFSCFTGLRLMDVKALKYEDIKREVDKDGVTTVVLFILPQKTDTTSGKLLQVPLSEQAVEILNNVDKNKDSDLIFARLPERMAIRKYLIAWGEAAGITKKMHFHAARHTFATMCLTYGVDIYTTSKLLGHSSVEKTEVYAKIIDQKIKQEVKKFPDFIRK